MTSSMERFERTLSETVAGEKLSGSRVDKVRSQASYDFHRADELASTIRRVHRTASSKAKISSLYLFDAMSRFAQDVIRKRASGFEYRDAEPPIGSKAKAGTKEAMMDAASAFLSVCEGIVEEIVLSTGQAVRSDQRDKVTKVVDIWIKANTFDVDTLERIRSKVMRGEGSSSNGSAVGNGAHAEHHSKDGTSRDDFRGTSMPSPYGMAMYNDADEQRRGSARTTKDPAAPPNVPSNILAMLGGGGSNAGATDAQAHEAGKKDKTTAVKLDPNQLAMLQRVAAVQKQQEHQQDFSQPSAESRPYEHHARQNSYNQPSQQDWDGRMDNGNPNGNGTGNDNKNGQADQPNFHPDQRVGDLSHFDISTFDPTQAVQWLRLAQHWYNTYQYVPSNQELLTGLMSVMQSQMYMQAQMMQTGGGGGGASGMESGTGDEFFGGAGGY